jgi:hypothetical protein
MQNNMKKGISNVVVNIVLLLVVVIAVSLSWYSLNYFFVDPNLSPKIDCFNNEDLVIERACLNSNSEVEVRLKRYAFSRDYDSIDFFIEIGGENSHWNCNNICGACHILEKGTGKTYYFDVTGELIEGNDVYVGALDCLIDEAMIKAC